MRPIGRLANDTASLVSRHSVCIGTLNCRATTEAADRHRPSPTICALKIANLIDVSGGFYVFGVNFFCPLLVIATLTYSHPTPNAMNVSQGQTGPEYAGDVPSPMFRLPPPAATQASVTAPALMRAGCAGCAANYGARFSNNDYGRVYNPRDRGFQGPVFGNGVFGSCGARGALAFECANAECCGEDYTHPAAREQYGRIGCRAPECTSNSDAVANIYARHPGKYAGCGANPLGDRLLENKFANAVGNWVHRLPRTRFVDIVKEFGEPDWIVNKRGGEAVWKNRAFYSRIVLKDESVEHTVPKPHCDFLTATVGGIRLPLEGIQELPQISESITYDTLKQELSARCHAMPAIVATLLVALDVALDDELTVAEAKEAYGQMVMDAFDPEKYTEMAQALEENIMEAHASNQSLPNFQCDIDA